MNDQLQPTPKGSKTGVWILVLVVIVIIAGAIYYFMYQDVDTDPTNANVEVNEDGPENLNTNGSTGISDRPVASIQTDEGRTTYSYSNAFDISFPSEWYFTTPRTDHPEYEQFLLIASNEDTSGVLGLRDPETGIVVNVYSELSDEGIDEYVDRQGVKPRDIPEDRVSISNVEVGGQTYVKRTVDATNLTDWEGTYSVGYFTKTSGRIHRVVFIALNRTAIDNNESSIEYILESIK